jgi:hypothetical protein
MANQIITKPLCLIKHLQIFIHCILYLITFTMISSNAIDYSYSMMSRHPWLKDTKMSHDWGSNINIIQVICIVRTIHVIKKLGV